MYVLIYFPEAQTQIMFNDSIKISSALSIASWTSDRKTVDTQFEYQVDIGSAQSINSPKNLIVAHQTEARKGTPNKKK